MATRRTKRGAYAKYRSGKKYMQCIADLKARGAVQSCWRCGKTLYADAPRHHPHSITLGHIIALEDGGEPYAPSNHAAECTKCNYGDGARRTNAKLWGTPYVKPGKTSTYSSARWQKPWSEGDLS